MPPITFRNVQTSAGNALNAFNNSLKGLVGNLNSGANVAQDFRNKQEQDATQQFIQGFKNQTGTLSDLASFDTATALAGADRNVDLEQAQAAFDGRKGFLQNQLTNQQSFDAGQLKLVEDPIESAHAAGLIKQQDEASKRQFTKDFIAANPDISDALKNRIAATGESGADAQFTETNSINAFAISEKARKDKDATVAKVRELTKRRQDTVATHRVAQEDFAAKDESGATSFDGSGQLVVNTVPNGTAIPPGFTSEVRGELIKSKWNEQLGKLPAIQTVEEQNAEFDAFNSDRATAADTELAGGTLLDSRQAKVNNLTREGQQFVAAQEAATDSNLTASITAVTANKDRILRENKTDEIFAFTDEDQGKPEEVLNSFVVENDLPSIESTEELVPIITKQYPFKRTNPLTGKTVTEQVAVPPRVVELALAEISAPDTDFFRSSNTFGDGSLDGSLDPGDFQKSIDKFMKQFLDSRRKADVRDAAENDAAIKIKELQDQSVADKAAQLNFAKSKSNIFKVSNSKALSETDIAEIEFKKKSAKAAKQRRDKLNRKNKIIGN